MSGLDLQMMGAILGKLFNSPAGEKMRWVVFTILVIGTASYLFLSVKYTLRAQKHSYQVYSPLRGEKVSPSLVTCLGWGLVSLLMVWLSFYSVATLVVGYINMYVLGKSANRLVYECRRCKYEG